MRFHLRPLIAVAAFVTCGWCCAPTWGQLPPVDYVTPPEPTAADVPEPATIDGCQVIARVDGQVVLACEVLWRVNQMLEINRDRIPPGEYEALRDQLMQRTFTGMIDQKLLYGEFRRNIPAENLPRIEENLLEPFNEREVPRLMKQLDVKSQRELEQRLSQLGSSLADTRQTFNEHVIASEWIRSKIKINEEVSPEEMVEYYRDRRAEFEFPAQVQWEELSVRKSGIPEQARQSFGKLALMGNEAWPRVAANPPATTPVFSDIALTKSEGVNARQGGQYDWTTKGALKATVVDEALFSLPPGQMSPILDSGTAFHIVRVLQRKDAGCRPFSEVQNDIREKLKDQRMQAAQDKYLDGLRKNAKVWTIYTGSVSVETLMAREPDGNQQR